MQRPAAERCRLHHALLSKRLRDYDRKTIFKTKVHRHTTVRRKPVQCIRGKDKIIINPIIEWSEADVWYFLKEVVKVKSCKLYAEGWTRIGCLFCPMTNIRCIRQDAERYPKYKDAILRTIHKLRENGYLNQYTDLTDSEVFEWWISKKGLKVWYFENKVQGKLFNL